MANDSGVYSILSHREMEGRLVVGLNNVQSLGDGSSLEVEVKSKELLGGRARVQVPPFELRRANVADIVVFKANN